MRCRCLQEDNYKEEIISTLSYLELKKIKKLIALNQKELEETTSPERQILLIQTHVRLKDLETKITKVIGTVICENKKLSAKHVSAYYGSTPSPRSAS